MSRFSLTADLFGIIPASLMGHLAGSNASSTKREFVPVPKSKAAVLQRATETTSRRLFPMSSSRPAAFTSKNVRWFEPATQLSAALSMWSASDDFRDFRGVVGRPMSPTYDPKKEFPPPPLKRRLGAPWHVAGVLVLTAALPLAAAAGLLGPKRLGSTSLYVLPLITFIEREKQATD